MVKGLPWVVDLGQILTQEYKKPGDRRRSWQPPDFSSHPLPPSGAGLRVGLKYEIYERCVINPVRWNKGFLMYNSIVHFVDDRHCARHEGSHGLKQNSWKIPGVPFDPKHGHLFYGKSGLKKMCTKSGQVIRRK